MPLLPPEKLNERAHKECAAAMQKLLTAPVFATPQSESCEWNPVLRRHLFRKAFVVWYNFDAIEMTVGEDGRVLAFRDRRRAEPKTPPELVPLTRKEVLEIAGMSGLLGPDAAIHHMAAGLKNMLVAVVSQPSSAQFPAVIEFTINPEARQIAAFTVIKV